MFYLKLAFNNIKQSIRVFAPFILANVVLFILTGSTLLILSSPMSDDMKYGTITLILAVIVLIIFSLIMSLYSYQFLLKQRSRELGLYNMIGMNKRKVGLVSTLELIFVYLLTISLGSVLCAVFANFFYLVFANLTKYDDLILTLNPVAFIYNCSIFAVIFLVLELFGLLKISRNSPLALFENAKAGEKEPRGNLILAFLGLAFLGTGYYLSITSSRISALVVLERFFLAVVLVIIGTYLFYISFLTWYLKARRKNKAYFYKPEHFITTSQMIFRMKQNAVGLANISLLAIMAFVTIATTTSLYAGSAITSAQLFPKNTRITLDTTGDKEENEALLKIHVLDKLHLTSDDTLTFSFLMVGTEIDTGQVQRITPESISNPNVNNISYLFIVTQDEFKKIGNDIPDLTDQQTLFYLNSGKSHLESLELLGLTFDNIQVLDTVVFPDVASTYNSAVLVVSNHAVLADIGDRIANVYNTQGGTFWLETNSYLDLTQKQLSQLNLYGESIEDASGNHIALVQTKEALDEELYVMYGGFLFTGFLLGISFLMGAALIIYYKQYSEGYEDKKSYTILQEVGMDEKQIKKTINSQVILVFFMPLAMAILHFLAALTMLKQMLLLFGISSTSVIYSVSAFAILAIILIYFIIYKFTSRTYYKIIER